MHLLHLTRLFSSNMCVLCCVNYTLMESIKINTVAHAGAAGGEKSFHVLDFVYTT